MAKEAKEQLLRLKSQEKRIDHFERAKRIEEIPVIVKYVEEKKGSEKVEWETHEAERICHLIEERKIAVATRDRIKRMRDDKNKFLSDLLESRRHVFVEKVKNFEEELARVRNFRLQKRKEERKEDRQMRYRQQIEDEERRKQDEIRRVEEEKQREVREKIEKELEERNRKTFEMQQAKERELAERDDRKVPGTTPAAGGAEKPAADVWRPASKAAAERQPPTAAASASSTAAYVPPWKKKQQVESQDDMPPRAERSDGFRQQPPDMERRDRDRDERKYRDREPEKEWERREVHRDRRERDQEPDFDKIRDRGDRKDIRPTGDNPRAPGRGGGMGRTAERGEDSWRVTSSRTGGERDRDSTMRGGGGPRRGGEMRDRERGDRDGAVDDFNWRTPAKKEEAPPSRNK